MDASPAGQRNVPLQEGAPSPTPYKPSWWLRGGHAQTLWPMVTPRVRLQVRFERLELPDGDFLNLHWVGQAGPIVVVLPGLQGDLNSGYVRRMLRTCAARGWRGVLLNYRGRGEPNRFLPSYHCGRTDDLHYLVHLLRQREPATPLAVVAFSVGANICLKWLGESGRNGQSLPVAAAVGVSAPFHLGVVAKNIESGFSRLYQWYLLKSLHRDVRSKEAVGQTGLNLAKGELRRLRTFFQFDDRISGPIHGFLGALDYYEKTRTDLLLRYVKTPTLILNARNDPLVPSHLIPPPTQLSPHISMEVTDTGGHLGFVSGRWPWSPRFWLDTRVPDYLARFFPAPA